MSGTRAGALKGWETRRHTRQVRQSPAPKQRETRPERKGERVARVSVRKHRYHGRDGYLISGRDTLNRSVSIFTPSQAEAARIRDAIKAGREPRFDFERERERERETAPKESPKESPFAPGWRRRLAYLEMLAAGQQRQIDDGYQVTFHKQALARTKREMTQLRKKLGAAGSK